MTGSASNGPSIVADTGPLQYLVLIGEVDLLPRLFSTVAIPAAVRAEMLHPRAPQAIRSWAAALPGWLTISTPGSERHAGRNAGENAVIALALLNGVELILMDDRAGVTAALAQGLSVIGTLGVLVRAARHDLVSLEAAFTRLQSTNFRYPPDLLARLLAEDRMRRGEP